METVTKFEKGNVYEMRFIGDSDLKPRYICLSRTAKTVTFEEYQKPGKPLTRRIKVYEGIEYILEGNYSMAPRIKADKVVM